MEVTRIRNSRVVKKSKQAGKRKQKKLARNRRTPQWNLDPEHLSRIEKQKKISDEQIRQDLEKKMTRIRNTRGTKRSKHLPQVTTRSLPGHSQVTLRSPLGHSQVKFRSLPGHSQVNFRFNSGHSQVTPRLLPGHPQVARPRASPGRPRAARKRARKRLTTSCCRNENGFINSE